MPNLLDTFRFIANDGISGATTVTPITSTLRRRWEREGDTRSYRVKLATKLKFRKADYTYFRDIYDAGECNEVTLLIENFCGGEWVTWHEGIIPIYNGDYNASRCEVTFEVKPNDVYECAKKSFGLRENWMNYDVSISIKTLLGEIETITCQYNQSTPFFHTTPQFAKSCWGTPNVTDDPDPDPALAWRPITGSHVYIGVGGVQYRIQTTWARETIDSASPPDGDGWINVSGTTWVRPVNTSAIKSTVSALNTVSEYDVVFDSQIINPSPISNAKSLAAILEAAVAAIDCDIDEVVSNFFNINPDATNPSNTPYTYAAANFANVFFFQKSDIVRASASNDATRFTFSYEEFLEEMKILNVFHSITNAGGVKTLRIEHYTYWDGANGMDLTTLDGGKYIVGKDDFKTDAEVPNFESFAYQESYRPKFLTKRITYPPACATVEGDERTANMMCTDFSGLLENPDAGLEGFFLLATHDLGGGEYLMNTLGGEANGAFAWENILPALWADGRFHPDATANVPGYVVNSVRKIREQVQITIQFCCEDTFEPSELVNTQLGWGEVKSAEEDTEHATLKLSLLQ